MAFVSTAVTSVLAFPCAYALAFNVSPAARRWAAFFLIIPFFTSYLVRAYTWQIFSATRGSSTDSCPSSGSGPSRCSIHPSERWSATSPSPCPWSWCCSSSASPRSTGASSRRRGISDAADAHHSHRGHSAREDRAHHRRGLLLHPVLRRLRESYYLGGSKPPTLSILIIDTTKSGQQWPRAAVVACTMIVTLFVVAFTAISLAYRKRA